MATRKRSEMFRRSKIGAKCDCGVSHDLTEHDNSWKRFLVPKGDYGDYWFPARYYVAWWVTLTCEKCGNVRDDFLVYRWSSDGDFSPVIPPFHEEHHLRLHADIKKAIIALMPE